jgi:hypothetical protein
MIKFIVENYRFAKFRVNRFKYHYDMALYSNSQEHLIKGMEYLEGLDIFGNKSKKIGFILASFIIKYFHRDRYKNLKEKSKNLYEKELR